MKFITIISLLAISLSSAQADLVVEHSVVCSEFGTYKVTTKIKGNKVRMDTDKKISAIEDLSTLESISISHKKKEFIRGRNTAIEEVRAAWVDPEKMKDFRFIRMNKVEKVGIYNCAAWIMMLPTQRQVALYTTTEFPNYEIIKGEWGKVTQFLLDAPDFTPAVEGAVLKMVVENGGDTTSFTVTSIARMDLDDSEFQVPEGYREIEKP